MSSCLDSDSNAYEASTDPTVHAFGLDTILGVSYPFAIDQLNRLIYNIDSLPVGSDTIIDSIRIDTFMVTGYVTSGDLDTILNINNYQNLTGATSGDGLRFRIYAGDLVAYRDYHLKINIHQQVPDSVQWASRPLGLPFAPSDSVQFKAAVCENELWVYVAGVKDSIVAYRTSAADFNEWEETEIDMPADADLTQIIQADDCLYIATRTGEVYRSADGIKWTPAETLNGVETLVCHSAGRLVAITEEDGAACFATATSDTSGWSPAGTVPANFPRKNLSATIFHTANGLEQVMVVGSTESEHIIPWGYDGLSWAMMDTGTSYALYCLTSELGNNPAILHYGDQFYMFGEKMASIYESVTGLAWYKVTKKFILPEGIGSGHAYSLAVDNDYYIYIVAASADNRSVNIWRGRLNRLGFARK